MAPPERFEDVEVSTYLELVGEPKEVLVIGESRGEFLNALCAQGASVACVPVSSQVDNNAATSLSNEFATRSFDVVILDHALERLAEPQALLDALREALRHGGFVLAVIPNPGHGARAEYQGGLTAEAAQTLFARAGFRLARVETIKRAGAEVYDSFIKASPMARTGREDVAPAPSSETLLDVQATVHAIEHRFAKVADRVHALQAQAESERLTGLRLRLALVLARRALDKTEDAWLTLYGELERSRSGEKAVAADLRNVLNRLYERSAEVDLLRRQLEEKDSYVKHVERAALADKAVMQEYIDVLRAQVADIPALREIQRQLLMQNEEIISSIQVESAQIVTLIDTVQSSQFWRLKRFLKRVHARVFRHGI